MGRNRRSARLVVAIAVLVALGACRADWSQWGGGPARTGENRFESTITSAKAGGLHQLWATDLGGFINAAPVVAADQMIGGTKTDVIYVGTERGEFYALRANGSVIWHRNLGSHVANCPDTPDNTYGVQASAVYDRITKRVFAVGGAGYVYALDPITGAVLPGWPLQFNTDPVHNSVYSAPTLVGDLLYIETASHCDQRPYRGTIVRVDTTWRVMTKWYAGAGSPTGPEGGGIWGWGGASIDGEGNVYVATGNLFTTPENKPYGDAVVKLDRDLHVLAYNAPGVLVGDDDFGSTPTLFQKPGCPPQAVVEQKNGTVYLYDRATIGFGPVQALKIAQGEDATHTPTPVDEFIGVPAWSAKTKLVYIANPSGTADGTYTWGMNAFRITASCRLALQWQTRAGTQSYVVGTPTVAGDVVYYPSGAARKIYAFDATTGAPRWNSGSDIPAPVFTAPAVVNGRVYAGAYDNKLHAWGL